MDGFDQNVNVKVNSWLILVLSVIFFYQKMYYFQDALHIPGMSLESCNLHRLREDPLFFPNSRLFTCFMALLLSIDLS